MCLIWYCLVILFTYLICESINKISNKMEVFALIVIVLSPLYWEYPNTGISVPATFSKEVGVVKHPFGVYTGFSGEYANIPVGGNSPMRVGLIVSEKQLSTSKQTLVLNTELLLDDLEVYFAKTDRRKLKSWFNGVDVSDSKLCRGLFSGDQMSIPITSICKDIRQVVSSNIYNYYANKTIDFEEVSKYVFRQEAHSHVMATWLNERLKKEGLAVVNVWFELKHEEESNDHIHWF